MDPQIRGAIAIVGIVIVLILILAAYGCSTGAWDRAV